MWDKRFFRSAVESGAGWNYCIKPLFKSRQSCDWGLSVQKVNWSRIVTWCGEGIEEPQNCSALEQDWAEHFVPALPGPPRCSDLPWTLRVFEGSFEKHLRGNARRVQNPGGWKQSNNSIYLFFFFPPRPINWNCWSLHRVIKMFYTVCLTAWLYFPLCCWYLLKSIPKCWLPLNFEAEKLQIHILIWFLGLCGELELGCAGLLSLVVFSVLPFLSLGV